MKNVTYINASAGSGKTYTLTHKLAELIEKKVVEPEQVIMTTFTTKAADEMKDEAKKVLYEAGLFEQATRLDQAMIGTVHAVANALINKYWFFLGLSPDMGVMDEDDTDFYISQSVSDLPNDKELELMHDFCDEFEITYKWNSDKTGLNYDFWKEDLKKIIGFTTNYEMKSYERSKQESLNFIHQFVRKDAKSSYTKEELEAVLKEHEIFLQGQDDTKENRTRLLTLKSLRRGIDNPTIAWYKKLDGLLKKLKKCGPLAGNMRENLTAIWNWQAVYDKQADYINLIFELAERWKDGYNRYKKEKNLLDYNDMEKYMRDMLNNDDLAKEISSSYRYLFVDEFQDCSPIQVKIFDRLSELMQHSYWVGDYKQAIYGFRGSDITLTKAVVDRIAAGKDGCEMAKPLDTSYRSLPDIVKVCNETFKETFKDVLKEEEITLKVHHENKEGIDSLRFWDVIDDNSVGILPHIAHLVEQGVKPSDIAVIGRWNKRLNAMAGALTSGYNIPASREDMKLSEMRATPLVISLLALVASEKDALAKAQIAYLTEEGFTTNELIDSKLEFDAIEGSHTKDFLNDVPLVKQLLALRPKLKQQSVASLVETMILELDLYNVVKKLGGMGESKSCLDTVIRAAQEYENHCVQMTYPATVNGLIDYLATADPKGVGDANGVQFHTYHSSKGLQFKYVILTSLHELVNEPQTISKDKIFGINFFYDEEPSAEMPYPEVYIRVVPFIYGASNSNVPDVIESVIEESDLFAKVRKLELSESNRLMYVGMTRPQHVLILTLQKPKRKASHSLQWLEDIGLEHVDPTADSDLLGVGIDFKDYTLPDSYKNYNYKYMAEGEKMNTRRIPYQKDFCEADAKYLSPSSQHEKGELVDHFDIGDKMPRGQLVMGKTMADVGNCIHQIYCGIEQNLGNEAYYKGLIEGYGLSSYLIDWKAIEDAWINLVNWLTENHGKATHIYHERPFYHLKDGQVFTGSIDLVWQTEVGDIVIDFKTCPMGRDAILDPDSEHYVGWYAGQLGAYTDALEAAGEDVFKRYIYYPVSGMLCEIRKKDDVVSFCGGKVINIIDQL